MKNPFLLLPIALFFVGCAGSHEPVSVEESLVTYTVTYDMGDWPARMIRIMQCDAETGLCDIAEPDGCRLVDDESVRGELTGHICDFTVAEGELLAFNVQLELHILEIETDTIVPFMCDPRPEIVENFGEVHVFRDGAPVTVTVDNHGEYCNFLVVDGPDGI